MMDKSPTIKRIVYGFAQMYPVMLARLCRQWRHCSSVMEEEDDSDEELSDKERAERRVQRMERTFPKYQRFSSLMHVSHKIIDTTLKLMESDDNDRRNYAIKLSWSWYKV